LSPYDVRRIFRSVTTRLRNSDLQATLDFLGEASSVDGSDAFPRPLLESLRRLVPSDEVVYGELDRVRETVLWEEIFPGETDGPDEPTYWDIRDQHPVCRHHDVAGEFHAMKISDFLTRSELRRTDIYWDWFRPWGVEYEMIVGLDAPLSHTKVFIFNRAGGGDFSERDRAILDILRPRLASLYQAAQARHRASQALALLEEADAGLVILDRAGQIEHVTPEALQLLSAYFRDYRTGLPDEIARWLLEQRQATCPEPLRVEGEEQSLLVNLVGGALLLEQERVTPPLTDREREILELVAAGKTNAEIAEAIWIAPGTVRKHLENIYEKLGVHSRTAAVATLNGE
jgi:DNA-binding CsgD family transcriptional regulator